MRPVLILLLLTSTAGAHSFYPQECCNGQDCSPIASSRVEISRDALGGYIVDREWKVDQNHVRSSPDGQYHACWTSRFRGPVCFFAPDLTQ